MGSTPENSERQPEYWLVCPVCRQPNPAGTLHCQHCWGASLYSVEPVNTQQLAVIMERNRLRDRRRKLFKITSVSVLAPLMLAGAVFLAIFSFTDVILPPSPELNSSPLPGEWTMFRHDLSRTGSINPDSPAPQGTLKWSFTTGAEIHSSPTVVDGTVYFGSRDFKLYAVDVDTGEKRWEFTAGTWIDSSPTVYDGIVYVGSNDGFLHAIDADTGEELWNFYTRYPVKSSVAVTNGTVIFGSDDYSIYCLDAKTGVKIWDYRTNSFVASSPAVENGIVYVGSTDGYLYALQADNGRFRLRVKTRTITCSPAIKDGIVYLNSQRFLWTIDGKARNWPGEHNLRGWWLQFYAFRLAPRPPSVSGIMWALPLGTGRASTSTPVVTDDTIYTALDSWLHSVDIESRTRQWTFVAGGLLRSSPALGNDILYIGSEDGRLYAVDATDGKKLWDFPTGDKITSSPALVDGVVYVGSFDGKLYAIE